ncbi:MFS transporter [Streptacidiphilus sp. P02-A3a]|uniref:MFS transporter n=1 Tax=Streptacidiphilus sp. P02-A3a TaxID=2704468 RepID=UPI0015FE3524|nr:MFS transporter [Streptacidiphilus sp. P02-A3a]QMU68972.1 MFS transporter [Streptacidiphilus sp. P02-A3a]
MNDTTTPAVEPAVEPVTEPEAKPPGYRWRWQILAVVLIAEVMDLLDSTVVNVAAPAIHAALGGGSSEIQWITAGYTLPFAVLLITGARLGDLVGRRRMFLIGATGFTICSALCALAADPPMLITSRALQGGFAAMLIPQGLGILRSVFPAAEAGAAFAAFGPVMGLSSVLGPTLGGLLVTANLFGTGWRMIFLINLPLGLATVPLAARLIPRDVRSGSATRLDLPGVALVSAAVLLLVFPLVQGRELGWPGWTYAAMAASLPLLAIFAGQQRRISRAGGSPLVEPSLFANRAYVAALATGLVFFAAMSGLMLTLTLMMQLGCGWTALHAGATMIPFSLGIVPGAILGASVLGPKFGRRVLHGGMLIAAVGSCGLWATFAHGGLRTDSWQLVPALLVTGFGMGLLMAPFFDIALAGVTDEQNGSASGVLNAVQQLGGSVGVAALGTGFLSWAASSGYVHATGWTLGCAAAALLGSALIAFALPKAARPHTG